MEEDIYTTLQTFVKQSSQAEDRRTSDSLYNDTSTPTMYSESSTIGYIFKTNSSRTDWSSSTAQHMSSRSVDHENVEWGFCRSYFPLTILFHHLFH